MPKVSPVPGSPQSSTSTVSGSVVVPVDRITAAVPVNLACLLPGVSGQEVPGLLMDSPSTLGSRFSEPKNAVDLPEKTHGILIVEARRLLLVNLDVTPHQRARRQVACRQLLDGGHVRAGGRVGPGLSAVVHLHFELLARRPVFRAGEPEGGMRIPPARSIADNEQAERCSLDVLGNGRSEEHTSELQSRLHLVCRLLLE